MPDKHKVEIGLTMRDSKLINGMQYSTEAWSFISDKETSRMEQVDLALIKTLIKGHSKCNMAFYYLEFGLLPIRFIISHRRIMFHHHIISRDEKETINKVYLKQIDDHSKGDWYKMILKDFELISEDEKVRNTNKEEYRKIIKEKVKISFLGIF